RPEGASLHILISPPIKDTALSVSDKTATQTMNCLKSVFGGIWGIKVVSNWQWYVSGCRIGKDQYPVFRQSLH
ncbi:MAG: hypothetical protein ABW201_14370, partial [Candidatus Thiodiazotropha sp.]